MSDWKPTACILCECNCGVEVQLGGDADRHLVKIRGDKRHPGSQGYACEKAHRLDHYQNGPHRLTAPLRRRPDGTFEEIDWQTAIAEVAERLAAARDTWGGPSIFYYGGGGQGNHLCGAYATATRRALGSRYRSSALAQEKTGEFWIADRMIGAQSRGDFEHCDVALFLGKNPWHSHSIPRARVTLKALSKDPDRTLIVIDPRRTETAKLADIHLQVKPGTDAWLLSAMVAMLLGETPDEALIDRAFLAEHASGLDAVAAAFAHVPVAEYCARAGLAVEQVRDVVRRIAAAKAFASFEDLGVQMNRHSTLVSYLHRLLWLLTGHFGRPGTQGTPGGLVPFAWGSRGRSSPVAGAPIISGLVPCNVIAEEILSEHPDRYRAMIVESSNPAHSLADGPRMREALAALETLVVIDVALTETAKLADYVLPAASQFEKAEATFFNFEFPENVFHLRRRLFEPLPGTLPEAEMHARLCEALGAVGEDDYAPLRAAAEQGLEAYCMAFLQHVVGHKRRFGAAAVILYRTLGPALPVEVREGAVLFGLALQAAMRNGEALARAGFTGPLAAVELFRAIIESPSGVVFEKRTWDDVKIQTADGRAQLDLPDMLEELKTLAEPPEQSDAFPFVLSAGERRSFTANTIIRDPEWRRKDADGALRMAPDDAEALGVATGDAVRLSTRRGSAVVTVEVSPTMQAGHVSLPNGLGLSFPHADGAISAGIAPNELTSADHRDRFVGTPWHKHVPARIEPITA